MLNPLLLRRRHMNSHDQNKSDHDYRLRLEHPQQTHRKLRKRNRQLNLARQPDWCHEDELQESMRRHKPLRTSLDGPLSIWDTRSNCSTARIQK